MLLPAVEICPAKKPPPNAEPTAGSAGVIELLAALDALGPYEFTAVTVTVNGTAVKPVTVIGEDAPDAVNKTPSEVLLAVATKLVIALPPTLPGAVKAMVSVVVDVVVAVPIVGASGFFSGS